MQKTCPGMTALKARLGSTVIESPSNDKWHRIG